MIERCEECKKIITKKMKASQRVIYANAEHTMDDGESISSFCDEMFGGVYCCQDCYEVQSGIKVTRTLAIRNTKNKITGMIDSLLKYYHPYRPIVATEVIKVLSKLKLQISKLEENYK